MPSTRYLHTSFGKLLKNKPLALTPEKDVSNRKMLFFTKNGIIFVGSGGTKNKKKYFIEVFSEYLGIAINLSC